MARHICPVWLGRFQINPLRRKYQDPDTILHPYVKPGMWTLDVGCAMGYFSFPLAEMVGEHGRVVCVDLQEGMIQALARRVRQSPWYARFDVRICSRHTLGLGDLQMGIDFALASAMVHETPDPDRLFKEIYDVLKLEGMLLVIEPRGHVSEPLMEENITRAHRMGFVEVDRPPVNMSHTVLLRKE
jgi:ubiquinone/menaquinone biosynthesis C-methylase UbiE